MNAGNESVTVGSNGPLSSIFCYFPSSVESRLPGTFYEIKSRGTGHEFWPNARGLPEGMVTLGID